MEINGPFKFSLSRLPFRELLARYFVSINGEGWEPPCYREELAWIEGNVPAGELAPPTEILQRVGYVISPHRATTTQEVESTMRESGRRLGQPTLRDLFSFEFAQQSRVWRLGRLVALGTRVTVPRGQLAPGRVFEGFLAPVIEISAHRSLMSDTAQLRWLNGDFPWGDNVYDHYDSRLIPSHCYDGFGPDRRQGEYPSFLVIEEAG